MARPLKPAPWADRRARPSMKEIMFRVSPGSPTNTRWQPRMRVYCVLLWPAHCVRLTPPRSPLFQPRGTNSQPTRGLFRPLLQVSLPQAFCPANIFPAGVQTPCLFPKSVIAMSFRPLRGEWSSEARAAPVPEVFQVRRSFDRCLG